MHMCAQVQTRTCSHLGVMFLAGAALKNRQHFKLTVKEQLQFEMSHRDANKFIHSEQVQLCATERELKMFKGVYR